MVPVICDSSHTPPWFNCLTGPLGITVWGDALDLSTERAQVVFHYTNFLAFKNITNEVNDWGCDDDVPSPERNHGFDMPCHASSHGKQSIKYQLFPII